MADKNEEKPKTPKAGTVIRRCTCSHEYQDKTYGAGMRVHNIAKKGDGARCTICATMR